MKGKFFLYLLISVLFSINGQSQDTLKINKIFLHDSSIFISNKILNIFNNNDLKLIRAKENLLVYNGSKAVDLKKVLLFNLNDYSYREINTTLTFKNNSVSDITYSSDKFYVLTSQGVSIYSSISSEILKSIQIKDATIYDKIEVDYDGSIFLSSFNFESKNSFSKILKIDPNYNFQAIDKFFNIESYLFSVFKPNNLISVYNNKIVVLENMYPNFYLLYAKDKVDSLNFGNSSYWTQTSKELINQIEKQSKDDIGSVIGLLAPSIEKRSYNINVGFLNDSIIYIVSHNKGYLDRNFRLVNLKTKKIVIAKWELNYHYNNREALVDKIILKGDFPGFIDYTNYHFFDNKSVSVRLNSCVNPNGLVTSEYNLKRTDEGLNNCISFFVSKLAVE